MASEVSDARRLPLSRERVLHTAIELADAGGIEALSMRKLAVALGVEAMSLYHHVANKPDLLDAMVEDVVAEIWIPSPGDDWRSAMRRRAASARDVLGRHPWALGLIESGTNMGPGRLRYVEAILACLRGSGFSSVAAAHAFFTLDSYAYGFLLQERSLPFGTPEERAEVGEQMLGALPPDEYPSLRSVVAEFLEAGSGYEAEFEFGLSLLLDGLERVRDGASATEAHAAEDS